MEYATLVAGLAAGVVITWLLMRARAALAVSNARNAGEAERAELRLTKDRLLAVEGDNRALRTALDDSERARAQLGERNTQHEQKLELLQSARQELTDQFKAAARDILDTTGRSLTSHNQSQLAQLLDPLKEKIATFQTKVEAVHVEDTRDRSALHEQVRQLTELNKKLGDEATNLTLALTGNHKTLGSYGEHQLETILQLGGFQAGRHYLKQPHHATEDGALIPDVVIQLPGGGCLVVDSKMTCPNYRLYREATEDAERQAALGAHLQSFRSHMRSLKEKRYDALYGIRSPEFVVMFVAVEPAYMMAITNDETLLDEASKSRVLLVGPTCLLFVVRTIASIWRQDDLTKNAREIAKCGGELYDKLSGFVTDLDRIGLRLDRASTDFDAAKRKLCGRNNLVSRALALKNWVGTTRKDMPGTWAGAAATADAAAAPEPYAAPEADGDAEPPEADAPAA